MGPHKSQRRTAANVYFRSSPYDLAPRIIPQPVIPADSSHVTSAKQCKNMFPNARGREQEGKDVFLFLKNVNSFRMFFFMHWTYVVLLIYCMLKQNDTHVHMHTNTRGPPQTYFDIYRDLCQDMSGLTTMQN